MEFSVCVRCISLTLNEFSLTDRSLWEIQQRQSCSNQGTAALIETAVHLQQAISTIIPGFLCSLLFWYISMELSSIKIALTLCPCSSARWETIWSKSDNILTKINMLPDIMIDCLLSSEDVIYETRCYQCVLIGNGIVKNTWQVQSQWMLHIEEASWAFSVDGVLSHIFQWNSESYIPEIDPCFVLWRKEQFPVDLQRTCSCTYPISLPPGR